MKTQEKSRSKLIPFFICMGMMIVFLVCERPLRAQDGFYKYDLNSILGELSYTDSIFYDSYNKTDNKNLSSGSNKWTFRNSLQKIISLLSQPIISRKSKQNGPYDVIIVPGFPYRDGNGACLILKARIRWAHYLISEGITKNIIFSGSAVYTPYIESHIMALYAMELGVPADRIFCETRAEHSTENIVYSLRLAEKLGFKKIAIATGPFQSACLSTYVKEHSLPVNFISYTINSMGNADPAKFPDIDPSTAFVEEFISLTDRETRSERFQGTLGNKIVE